MKNIGRFILTLSACLLTTLTVAAFDEEGDKPRREGQRDGDRPAERGDRDGDKRGERGPRDGDGERRGARDGDRRPPGRGPRDGDRPPIGGPILSALDTNHNGILESEEIDRAIVILRRMDKNRDGKLTGEEFGRHSDGGPPPREGDRYRGGRSPEGEAGRGNRPSPEQMMARFKEADTNDDGKLSRDEAPDRMKQGFDRIDRNEDGFVDKSEFEAMIRNMRGGGRPPGDGEGRRPREGGDREGRNRDGDRDEEGGVKPRRPESE